MSNRTSLGRFLIGGVVAALAIACTADAVQTNSTPNAAFISYSLAAGGATGGYVPPANQSTLIMGTCITSGVRGVGSATVLRVPSAFIEWSGQNSTTGAAATPTNTGGFSGSAGSRIINLDFSNQVLLEVAGTDTVRVRNTSTAVRAGNLTWVW